VRDEWLAKRGIRVLRYSDREALLEPEAIEEAAWRALRNSRFALYAALRGRVKGETLAC